MGSELFAVYTGLQYFEERNKHVGSPQHRRDSLIPVHIFTDSLFTQGVLCGNIESKKHFYLIEEIHNLASNLSYVGFSFVIHWIPSHIEHISFGYLPIKGNVRADQPADRARMTPNLSEFDNNFNITRVKLLNSGNGAKSLNWKGKLPVELVYAKRYRYYMRVLQAEQWLKRRSRAEKEALIQGYEKAKVGKERVGPKISRPSARDSKSKPWPSRTFGDSMKKQVYLQTYGCP